MSKQSNNKLKQGYEERPVHKICGNCKHQERTNDEYGNAKTRRCKLGDFKIKATATCKCFERSCET